MHKFCEDSNSIEDTNAYFNIRENTKSDLNLYCQSDKLIKIIKNDDDFEKQFSPPESSDNNKNSDEISNIEKKLKEIIEKEEIELERVNQISVRDFKIPKKIIKDEQAIINSELKENEKKEKIKEEQQKKEKKINEIKKKNNEKEVEKYYFPHGVPMKSMKDNYQKIVEKENKRRRKIRNLLITIVSFISICVIILILFFDGFFVRVFK